jgi:hypothetical protein
MLVSGWLAVCEFLCITVADTMLYGVKSAQIETGTELNIKNSCVYLL